MAGNLRIHADVVERACRDRGDDRSGTGTAVGGRTVVTSLTGRYGPDDQPYQHDETSDSHAYLRKTGGSGRRKEPRTQIVLSSTPGAVVIRLEGIQYGASGGAGAFPVGRPNGRCIVTADGLGCEDRGRVGGASGSGRSALHRAWWRLAAFAVTQ
jgi:hypothetical protein